jgi:peptidoglycan/LPS O-acetylase OafA/YrhL
VPPLLERPITGWLALAGLALVLAQAKTPERTTYLAAAVLATLLILSLLTDGQAGAVSDRPLRQFAERAAGALSAALSSRPLRFTGKTSYGIYLYHLPIYYLLLNYAPGRSHYFYGAVVLAASLLAAASSWKLLESPIIHGSAPGSRIKPATVPTSISGDDMLAVTGLRATQRDTADTTTGTGGGGSTSTTSASNAKGATAAARSRYWAQETQKRAA